MTRSAGPTRLPLVANGSDAALFAGTGALMRRQRNITGMSRSVRLSIAALVWVAVLSGCAGGALTGTAVQGTTGAEAGVPTMPADPWSSSPTRGAERLLTLPPRIPTPFADTLSTCSTTTRSPP